MGIQTAIEYADSTVNPVMGCTGCELLKDHCYARRLCNRYAGLKGWPKDFTKPEHFPGRLEKALKWKDLTDTKRPGKPWLDGMPRIVFVNDLSDGWCPRGVSANDWLAHIGLEMEDSPHIWLFLTKWPDRMRRWFDNYKVADNFWLGTTLLRQDDTWRLDELSQIKGGKKWISAEPLLGKIDLDLILFSDEDGNGLHNLDWSDSVDFVVTGGETGPGARPTRLGDFRSLRDECRAAKVPFFFKSWGAHQPHVDGTRVVKSRNPFGARVLDRRAWRQMPSVAPRNK